MRASPHARPGVPVDLTRFERRNWQALVFVVFTTMLLALALLTLIFPGVAEYLLERRGEGDLDRYGGLLVVAILLYCLYVLRMQLEFRSMRQQVLREQANRRGLQQLVGQFKRLAHLASTVHRGQGLEQTLQVLAAAAQESLRANAIAVMVRHRDPPSVLITSGDSLLTDKDMQAIGERLADSQAPLEVSRPPQLAALLGEAPAGLTWLLAMPLRDSYAYLGVLVAEMPGKTPAVNGDPAALLGEAPERPPARSAELDTLGIFVDHAIIAIENDALVRRMERMALLDELTGLFNRRYFNQALEREIPRSERNGRPFCLLLFDLDHFKEINDTYGHDAGDQALIRVARALEAYARKSNILARFGGEEFATLLLDTGEEGARVAAEHMRQAVEQVEDLPQKITISVGIAVYPQHGSHPDKLLKSADDALYVAKKGGRNQVRVAKSMARAAG